MAQEMIPVAVPDIGETERRYVLEAVESGWISSIGPFIGRFESEFAAFCEARHGIAVSNGTTALEVALKALGVGPGDEVILPALTFAAVGAVVVHLGASPVLVDVHPDHWCLDPQAVARALSGKTRALVAVHSYGHPADMDPILDLCRAGGVAVVEDCAEAHGARYKGRRVGSLGAVGCFSFYGNKIVTTGEGGMVTTDDDALASRIRFLKDHAMDPSRRYFHLEAGYNFRMTNVQAAMGCAQMERIEVFLEKRKEILGWYREALEGLPGLALNPREPWAEPVNWMVCARLHGPLAPRRDGVLAELRANGVDTRPFFVPLAEMPPYRGARRVAARGDGLPVAAELGRTGFNLPTSTVLGRDQILAAGRALRGVLERSSATA